MWIQNILKSLTSTSTRRPARRPPVAALLRVEPLEDRSLPSFGLPVNYGVGLAPEQLVSADFNGDGRLDVATANHQENTVGVLLGNGDGTFQPARTSVIGVGAKTLVARDLNGDGRADLVRFNYSNLIVLLANGDGTFQPPQAVALPAQFPPGYTDSEPLGQGPISVAVGDLNGDGKLDLIAGALTVYFTGGFDSDLIGDNYANVLLGNGDGTFRLGAVNHLPGGYPNFYPGDFNNDGRLDIVLSGGTLLGNGDGTLQDLVVSSVSVHDVSNPVGDFNGDGKLDVLSDSQTGPFLQLGNGDGTFQQYKSIDLTGYWHSTVVGDVNADGKLDIVESTSVVAYTDDGYGNLSDPVTTRSARVLLGNGDGSFAPVTVDLGTLPGISHFTSPVLADFDGDRFPDLAASEYYAVDDSVPGVYRPDRVSGREFILSSAGRAPNANRRVFQIAHRVFPQAAADAALRVFVLELAREPRAPANAAVGAGHIRHQCAGSGSFETIGLRDHVSDLVTAPTMALNADGVLFDEALIHDGLHGRQHALQRALTRITNVVDNVRHQDQITVAGIERSVD